MTFAVVAAKVEQAAKEPRHRASRRMRGPLAPLSATDVIPAWVWEQTQMVKALGVRDIGAVYGQLQRLGLSQRAIAARTSQSQSEVAEVMAGRRIASFDVLVQIADGLRIPRAQLGFAGQGPGGPISSPTPPQSVDSVREPAWISGDAPPVQPEATVLLVRRCVRCDADPQVDTWTGREIRFFRQASRMGVSARSGR